MNAKNALKLCVCFLVAFCGGLLACAAGELGAAVTTAEKWTDRVCRLVEALPQASASALPPNVNITVNVSESSAVATVSATPTSSAMTFVIPLPPGANASAKSDAGSEASP